ncbi:TrkH family potassium uptake protein [Geosporobacter ferrireducens]|uniref:Trk family potassium uptake protein n=1 Tax=Geosporobacter ferrireducens TaxID=1424294 RepID=A0A1D8GQ01_9FIRM|nr:TrkH family potassium uptake protein [Geosporobacter ferrireducens]AOT72985.1 Trk family potassium uptake protein [Geosporobacter ferrireducens]MTI56468.1 Trk family potassium uptake protein [Geosporobacter ferrireducens]
MVLGFASVILIGSILLNLPIASRNGESIGFVNALFTATSAVCVTGLVVVDTGTYWTVFGQTVILFLIQIGGLGFMTLATLIFFILGKKITLRERLVMQEALNQFKISGIVRLTQYILVATFLIEGIGAILLSIRFIPIFGVSKGIAYSIFHSISAFCNAGFDLMGDFTSLTSFVNDPLVNVVVWILIVIGGLGFTVVVDCLQKKRFSRFSLHTKMVLSISAALIGLGFIMILILEYSNPATMGNLPLRGKLLSGMFHGITPRTAGFNTLPTDQLTTASIFLTIVLMFIGGSSASTAGGVKTTTAGVVIWTIVSVIKGNDDTEIFQKRIPRDIINRSLAVIGIAMLLIVLMTMVLSITEKDFSFVEIFFEATSAFGTVGLSLGITPSLSLSGRILVSITMFAGRVGPLTLALAVARQQKKKKGLIKYPEEKVIVG